MEKSEQYILIERMQYLNGDHKFILTEEKKKKIYGNLLMENERKLFQEITEIFLSFNKLTGILSEDKKYLKEFTDSLENDDDFDPFAHLLKTKKIDVKTDCVLTISPGNQKIHHPYLSLPAGYTCPFADICKTMVPRDRTKIDNKLLQDFGDIRCYAASEEARHTNAQTMRWRNYDLVKEQPGVKGKADLILRSLDYYESTEGKINLFRIHESGDFYNQEYFDAWIEVAKERADVLFYAYTKSLRYWVARIGNIPRNFKLVASVGGKEDSLIDKYNLRFAKIVDSPEQARALRLPIDIDDSLAYNTDGSFALLIHGSQKAGSEAEINALRNREIVKKFKGK